TDRQWEPDPIPFPVSTETWELLGRGVAQRMRLLTSIYNDIYGPQSLIRNGHLPPEILFANPAYLRQCHGIYTDNIPPLGNRTLHFHGTDICHFPDGEWKIVSHRTQSPRGAGYALENRIVLSGILPRMFHSGKVLRLAPFFKYFTRCLMEISGMVKREPNIVMLSPGPSGPDYFEQVFLSRYLGLTLVESSDLTVRSDSLFLKTLGGLHPVDVIFRRIDDIFCDPLIFGSTSLMGVPGLIQAVRAGNVAVSNPPGSGVLETPALTPFLGELCKILLGESLILGNIPTFWCGNPASLSLVLDRIAAPDKGSCLPLVVTSSFTMNHGNAVDITTLGSRQRESLMEKIKAAPYAHTAMEISPPCTLPVWEKGTLQYGHGILRLFSIAGSSVSVMPGALTRVSRDPMALILDTIQGDGRSKDTWCFSDEPVIYKSMLHNFTENLEIHRGSDLPSRVADNMLWLGRYIERTEGMLRLIRTILTRLNSETRLDLINEMPFLIRIMANLGILSPGLSSAMSQPTSRDSMTQMEGGTHRSGADRGDTDRDGTPAMDIRSMEAEILDSLFSPGRPESLYNSLQHVKRVATSVRDRLSNDSWNILGRMENQLKQFSPHDHSRISEAQELVNEMILVISAFAGLALESMTRGMGWRFLDMGRRLERADYTITLLQSLFLASENETPSMGHPQGHELEALLEVADSTITYHTRYRTTLQMEPIMDLLLLDELNPRSTGFQLATLFEHVETLPRDTPRPFRTREEKITLELTTRLRLTDMPGLMEMNQQGEMPKLNELLTLLKQGVQELGNQITQHYLSRIETEKQMRHLFAACSTKNVKKTGCLLKGFTG
ncbi:MAG: circularly permuted type 2 ATP-grasp protein, partial [Desulfamplus sp.]|nr:circularly permuted type 2 ATP-grasp protein [Desulfamplus sp.]